MKTATLGTVCSGSLRTEDLIPEFARELRRLRGAVPKSLAADVRRAINGTLPADEAGDVLWNLEDELQAYAPPYAYFGTHGGDGADFGYWLCDDWQQQAREDGALLVADLSELKFRGGLAPHRGYVVHVNDHGNATLYWSTGRSVREVWSIV